MTQAEIQQAASEIWAILKENSRQLQAFQSKTDKQFEKSKAETDAIRQLFEETDKRIEEARKETDKRLEKSRTETETIRQLFKETDKRLEKSKKELDRRFKETDEHIKKVSGLFGNQWGRLMEALVAPDVVRIFQERGLKITGKSERWERHHKGDTLEVDLLLTNTTQVMMVEVKTMVSLDDVKDLLGDLDKFFNFFPEYKTYSLFGAIAGLNIPHDVSKYAYRRGLFVVSITGQGLIKIQNDQKFKPRDFSLTEK